MAAHVHGESGLDGPDLPPPSGRPQDGHAVDYLAEEIPVAPGADRPLVREQHVAANVHGETGLDGPSLPPPAGAPLEEHAVAYLAATVAGKTLVPTGPLTNVALMLALHPDARPGRIVLMGGAIGEGNTTPAAEFNIWADPEAARRAAPPGRRR